MTSIGSPSPFFFGGKKAYAVDRSLRFNDDDDTNLQRTVSSTSNRKTFTVSAWIKPSRTDSKFFFAVTDTSGYEFFYIGINSYHRLVITDYDFYNAPYSNVGLITNRLFRDPSAWYHIVVAFDTTQATNTNRVKLYVNGVQETSWYNEAYPVQNLDTYVNHTTFPVYIGKLGWGFGQYDGYMAEYNFIDGLQLTPSSFGETDAITGQWNPKKYVGSYGTNGFYLNFSDNSGTTATTLGKDSSGNGNNFTPNNFSVADGIDGDSFADTPTNNFCVLNAVVKSQSAQSLANGNLQRSGNAYKCVGTHLLKNNKYYFEVKVEDGNGNAGIGVTQADTDYRDRDNTEAAAYFTNGEYKIEGGSQLSGWSTYGNGDIIGVAIDTTLSTPKVWFSKNNTWQGTGDPTTAGYSLTAGKDYVFNIDHTSGSSSTTATAFFGAHKGEFNYTPPTGFVAASSANLPDPTILLPNKHFDTLLYTGNATDDRDITGLNFQPDWLWIKERSGTESHLLFNSVVGTSNFLKSNSSASEANDPNALQSFNSDGFQIGTSTELNANSETYVAWNWNGGDTDGKTYAVTVVPDSGNKYRFDGYGTSAVTLDLAEGGTYIFDWSDSSAQSHPIRFSTTADGTHGGGSEYTTGVVKDDSNYKTTITVAASAPTLYYYCQYHSGMGGQANTNSTLGSSNFDGGIQSTVKANTTSGFSIVTYTGNGSAGATVGHGLGVIPRIVIVKRRNSGDDWRINIGPILGSGKEGHSVKWNSTGGEADTNSLFNSTNPTSSVFTIGNDADVNSNGSTYLAYCFSDVTSYSKFDKYIGNGNENGTFVFTGFRPAWLLFKNVSSGSTNFILKTAKIQTRNVMDNALQSNRPDAESSSLNSVDFLSNGFKIRNTGGNANTNGDTYIYWCFAEFPFKNARAR